MGVPLLSNLVAMEDPWAVFAEVEAILRLAYPQWNVSPLQAAFETLVDLFDGRYPGYYGCDTVYHDMRHNTDVMLAMARLIHGARVDGKEVKEEEGRWAMIASIFHDTGYIRAKGEEGGTGAQFTATHVRRSIAFTQDYLRERGESECVLDAVERILLCTDLSIPVESISFPSEGVAQLGRCLGTADLVGQMADRTYLEKLLFLFHEFQEAQIGAYRNEYDLLLKTRDFYQVVCRRLREDLGDVQRFFRPHFRERWGCDRDLYADAMAANMNYLDQILAQGEERYQRFLRRRGRLGYCQKDGKTASSPFHLRRR